MTTQDQKRWLIVSSRSHPDSDYFVYGVRTTGIYCRPTCQSRLARRANVKFFDSIAEAVTAGYRACKRCKPGQTDFDARDERQKLVQRACVYMHDAGGDVKLVDVAKHVGLSLRYFQSLFSKTIGVPAGEYCANLRARKVGDDTERFVDGELDAEYQSIPALPAFDPDVDGSLFDFCASGRAIDHCDGSQAADDFTWTDEDFLLYRDLE